MLMLNVDRSKMEGADIRNVWANADLPEASLPQQKMWHKKQHKKKAESSAEGWDIRSQM